METTASPALPNYQQQQQQQQPAGVLESSSSNPIPQAVPIGSSSSSGSIGPFFAVISVITILAFLSCFVGRILTRDQVVLTPLGSINGRRRSCLVWLKRRCIKHHGHLDVEAGSTKVKEDVAKVKEGDEAPSQQQQA